MRSLKSVSNIELIKSLKKLVQKEQDLTLHILRIINEVEDRGIYLELAYSTITEYCIHELGYGDSSAGRRVRVARLIRKVPEVYDLLIKKNLTFSVAVQVASVLSPDNKDDLLPRLIGKSRSEIDKVLSGYQIPRRIADQARPTLVKKIVRVERAPAGTLPGGRGEANMELDIESLRETRPEELGEMPRHCDGANGPMPGVESVEVKEVVERMFEIRFAGDDELMELINFMRSHLSHRFPKGAGFLDIFKYAMRYIKDREDLALQKESTRKSKGATDTRYIPKSVKQSVWKRDKGRCTFIGAHNKRCDSDYLIQYDHYPVPFARGGRSTINNLRLLCAKHNRHTAKKTYGEAVIKRHYIKEAGAEYITGRGGVTGPEYNTGTAGGWRWPAERIPAGAPLPVRVPGSSPIANHAPGGWLPPPQQADTPAVRRSQIMRRAGGCRRPNKPIPRQARRLQIMRRAGFQDLPGIIKIARGSSASIAGELIIQR